MVKYLLHLYLEYIPRGHVSAVWCTRVGHVQRQSSPLGGHVYNQTAEDEEMEIGRQLEREVKGVSASGETYGSLMYTQTFRPPPHPPLLPPPSGFTRGPDP